MQKRRSFLFIAGNSPSNVQDAPVFNPDAIVFDLADRVDNDNKDSARHLIQEAIKSLDYSNVEVIVQINPLDTDFGSHDLSEISRVKPGSIMVPHATSEMLKEIDLRLSTIEKEEGFEAGSIKLIPVIDSALGVESTRDTLNSSQRITAVWFNAENLLASFGTNRTKEGDEIRYARSHVAMECRAKGIEVIDTFYNDPGDAEGLQKDSENAKRLGLTGKAALDGRQIDIINTVFA